MKFLWKLKRYYVKKCEINLTFFPFNLLLHTLSFNLISFLFQFCAFRSKHNRNWQIASTCHLATTLYVSFSHISRRFSLLLQEEKLSIKMVEASEMVGIGMLIFGALSLLYGIALCYTVKVWYNIILEIVIRGIH